MEIRLGARRCRYASCLFVRHLTRERHHRFAAHVHLGAVTHRRHFARPEILGSCQLHAWILHQFFHCRRIHVFGAAAHSTLFTLSLNPLISVSQAGLHALIRVLCRRQRRALIVYISTLNLFCRAAICSSLLLTDIEDGCGGLTKGRDLAKAFD